MLFGHVIFAMSNLGAPTIELKASCWALREELEYVKWCL
jgi:hypothetical protein